LGVRCQGGGGVREVVADVVRRRRRYHPHSAGQISIAVLVDVIAWVGGICIGVEIKDHKFLEEVRINVGHEGCRC